MEVKHFIMKRLIEGTGTQRWFPFGRKGIVDEECHRLAIGWFDSLFKEKMIFGLVNRELCNLVQKYF